MNKRIKQSYICKDVKDFTTREQPAYIPRVGDVGIFEVLRTGKHTQMQNHEKRNAAIYPGDLIMAAFGTRYATEQFEGYVPEQILDEYHILGAGGTVGEIHSMHAKFLNIGPTTLKLKGFAVDSKDKIINTIGLKRSQMLQYHGAMQSLTRVILSIGTSMDSGKTTTAAHLVRGLKKSGLTAGYMKLTGTVYTKDADLAFDNGADEVIDFSAMGFPSTYMCSEEELMNLYETLLAKMDAPYLDYVVVEIADGIYQRETEMLLRNTKFMSGIDGVIFSAGDSLSAVQGVQALQQMHIMPTALCGLFTASPLLVREVQARLHTPIFNIAQMAEGACVRLLEQPMRVFA
ncbi:MAG: DUF1611 domain-containing protein [Dinghuibacter sp.]|nr:DUF1611 domain-containing protein [Dinghuibacter sp.]